jgi:hypothetical protein
LFDGSFGNNWPSVGVRIEVIWFERFATPLAISIHLSHQCHDRAGNIPVMLTFGFSHLHQLSQR